MTVLTFQGASDFKTLAENAKPASTPSQSGTSGSQPNKGIITLPLINVTLGLWEASVLALVVFAVGFLLVTLIIRPRIERHRAVKAEMADAERRAELVAQQIKTMEAAQRQWIEHNRVSEQPRIPIQQQGLPEKMVMRKTISDFHCPNCGALIDRNANYCPNCHLALISSESGPHLHVPQPSTSSAPSSTHFNN